MFFFRAISPLFKKVAQKDTARDWRPGAVSRDIGHFWLFFSPTRLNFEKHTWLKVVKNLKASILGYHENQKRNRKYRFKVTWLAHIDNLHKQIKHKCPECGKMFTQKSSLNQHIESIHEQIKHQCPECGQMFSLKRSVKQHIESIHKQMCKR